MRNTKDLNIKITPSIRDAYETVFQKMYSNRRVLFEDMFRVYLAAEMLIWRERISALSDEVARLEKVSIALAAKFSAATTDEERQACAEDMGVNSEYLKTNKCDLAAATEIRDFITETIAAVQPAYDEKGHCLTISMYSPQDRRQWFADGQLSGYRAKNHPGFKRFMEEASIYPYTEEEKDE